jgi:hypothetical protein
MESLIMRLFSLQLVLGLVTAFLKSFKVTTEIIEVSSELILVLFDSIDRHMGAH